MLWIGLFVISALLLVAAQFAARAAANSANVNDRDLAPWFRWGSLGAFVLGFFLSFAVFSVHVIDAREVGVVRTFGSITGQVGEGFQLTFPWQTVEKWNVRVQVIEPDTQCSNGAQRCMDAGSVDVQDVYVQGVLNISVNPSDIQDLAREVGQGYTDTIVRNRLYQVVKEVTAEYRAADILGQREAIRTKIREAMIAELSEYSVTVIDFLITNIDFRAEFKQSIEDKVRAEQEALAEQNRVEIARAQAEQRAATAEGEANRLRIEAQGQADANRLISESLTPELVQWQAVQTLADNISIALIPSGEGIIIDPATLFRPPAVAPVPAQ
jgi:regulator of protease activity HflC (stomatin/prohibitin superfamily)